MDITLAALLTISYWCGMFVGYQIHDPCEHHESSYAKASSFVKTTADMKAVLIKEDVNKNEKEDPLLKKDLTDARTR